MYGEVLDCLFGCSHSNTSNPFTPRRSGTKPLPAAAIPTGTYIVCLDCGKEFPYDLQQMKVVKMPAYVRPRTEAYNHA